MSKLPRQISSPAYIWFVDEKMAELRETIKYETPVRGHVAAVPHGLLAEDGVLWISSGFRWNLGSGPAMNNPGMVYASLAHDCFYYMLQAGELPWHERKRADQFFKRQLTEYGGPWWRRNLRWMGVRYGYPIARQWDKLKKAVAESLLGR